MRAFEDGSDYDPFPFFSFTKSLFPALNDHPKVFSPPGFSAIYFFFFSSPLSLWCFFAGSCAVEPLFNHGYWEL